MKLHTLLALLLLTAAMLCLFSCENTEQTGTAQTEDTASAQNSSADMVNVYTIVRADADTGEDKDAAVALRKFLREMGYDNDAIETDWVKYGEDVENHRFAHEILVGETNRPESAEAYDALNEYTRDMLNYRISSDGNDYCIAASEGHIGEAVEAFCAMIRENPDMLSGGGASFTEEQKHIFPLDSCTLAGQDISAYTSITYADDYPDVAVDDIKRLSKELFYAAGIYLPVKKASETDSSALCIRIGTRTDEAVQNAGLFSYSVTCDENGLSFDGHDVYTDMRGVDEFRAALSAASGSFTYDDAYQVLNEKKDSLILSAWVISSTEMTEEEQFAEIAECGYNQIIMTTPSAAMSDASFYNTCKWMAKYELQGLFSDSAFYYTSYDASAELPYYVNTDVFFGALIKDEPNTTDNETLRAVTEDFEKRTGKTAYVNLFPIYASEEQLQNSSYKAYCEAFLDTVKPTFTSMDVYPMNNGGSINSDYLENLDIFSTACRERGVPFGIYIQSVSFNAGKRTPDEAEMRWQAYCALSFGATDIEYFTYRTPDSDTETFLDALIGRDNEKTERWEGAQKINTELSAFGDILMQYTNLGAYTVSDGASLPAYAKFKNQYSGDAVLKEVTTDGALLIGVFENADGDNAYTVVNMADPGSHTVSVKAALTFPEGSAVTMWENGVPETVSGGKAELTLAPGACLFLTVEN